MFEKTKKTRIEQIKIFAIYLIHGYINNVSID